MKPPEDTQRALLTLAVKLLRINVKPRIVIDTTGHAVGLSGRELRIIFEPPGVIRVYNKQCGTLLVESAPGRPEDLAQPDL
jgi:hypothetical protein